jgi:hypothetical protein
MNVGAAPASASSRPGARRDTPDVSLSVRVPMSF